MPTPAIALLIVPSFPRASAHLFRNLCGYIICWPTRKAPFLQALLCMSLAIASAVPSFHLSKPTVPLSDCLRIDCWPASRARIYTSAVIYPPSDRVVGRSLTSLASNPISVGSFAGISIVGLRARDEFSQELTYGLRVIALLATSFGSLAVISNVVGPQVRRQFFKHLRTLSSRPERLTFPRFIRAKT
jgi:hypothetical protein